MEFGQLSVLPPVSKPAITICAASLEQTIVARQRRFRYAGALSLGLGDAAAGGRLISPEAGPLFCGGITVFNPLLQENVLPVHQRGRHRNRRSGPLALQFLNRWGCDVTAFTSSGGEER